mgnify:CR=1 FL=1
MMRPTHDTLQLMREFPENETLQKDACQALLTKTLMTYELDALSSQMADEGGIELLVKAMNRFCDSVHIVTSACRVLSILANASDANKRRITEAEGIDSTLWALNKYTDVTSLHESGNALLYGCIVVQDILASSSRTYFNEVTVTDGIPVIVRTMMCQPSSAKVQINACQTLAYLVKDNDKLQDIATSHGGILACIAAIRLHHKNFAVCQAAFGCLRALASSHTDSNIFIVENGIVDLIMDMLATYCNGIDAPLQKAAVALLANLSQYGWAASTNSPWQNEVLGAFCDALLIDYFMPLGAEILLAIRSLVQNKGGCVKQAVDLNVPRAILRAMKTYANSLDFQEQGILTLLTLSSDLDCWKQIWGVQGSLDIVTDALTNHSSNSEQLLENALKLLVVLSDGKAAVSSSVKVVLEKILRESFRLGTC